MTSLAVALLCIYVGVASVLAALQLLMNGFMGSTPSNPLVLIVISVLWPVVLPLVLFLGWLDMRRDRRAHAHVYDREDRDA